MGFVYIPLGLVKALIVISIFSLLLFSKRKGKNCFALPVVAFFICLFINMLYGYWRNNQSPYEFFKGSEFQNMLGILVLFCIPFFKISVDKVEHSLILLSEVFVFFYIIQYLIYPTALFIATDEMEEVLDARFRMPGQAAISILFFYSLNQLLKNITVKFVTLLLLSALCLLLLGFRSQLAALFVCSVFYVVIYVGLKTKIMVYGLFSLVAFFAFIQIPVVQLKMEQLMTRNQQDSFNDDEYVRYISLEYFTETAPENNTDRILGIGLPGKSKYGQMMTELKPSHIIWADWGLLGLSWVAGIPVVLCMLWYSLKAVFQQTPKDYLYLRFWFLFLILASLLTREMFRTGNFALQGVVLYILSVVHTRSSKREL